MDTKIFKHFTTVEFGVGAAETIGDKVKEFGGTKALLVTDPGLISTGMIDTIEKYLQDAQIPVVRFADIKGNPVVGCIEQGVKVMKDNGCDITIAIGGGSSMDVAKAINIVEANGGNILDYEVTREGQKNPLKKRKKPLIAIPTTSGTGSGEVCRSAGRGRNPANQGDNACHNKSGNRANERADKASAKRPDECQNVHGLKSSFFDVQAVLDVEIPCRATRRRDIWHARLSDPLFDRNHSLCRFA